MRPAFHHWQKAITLLAALMLILSRVVPVPATAGELRPAAVHASVHAPFDCPEHGASPQPADHHQAKHAHHPCCMMAGGPAAAHPSPNGFQVPFAAGQTIQFHVVAQASAGTAFTPSMGARAPPLRAAVLS